MWQKHTSWALEDLKVTFFKPNLSTFHHEVAKSALEKVVIFDQPHPSSCSMGLFVKQFDGYSMDVHALGQPVWVATKKIATVSDKATHNKVLFVQPF